ncbi:unnamed protein product [Ceutorhynchus assimilis]|uniref:PHD-type domain-containing protein n=1 Tax=Ceutorhynchus assimilis TaxID=467358 RepID=A0A9N9MYG8_9CUCU|nr:unnamed protein product [Ceutorhynchus assimilis]
MHDLCEGVHRYSMAVLIDNLIRKKYFTLDNLNARIRYFTYQISEKNVPPPVTKQHLLNGCIIFSASEMFDLIPDNEALWIYYLSLLEIIQILTSQSITTSILQHLETLIDEHHQTFLALFNTSLKPKFHLLVHYVHIIEKIGPPIFISSFKESVVKPETLLNGFKACGLFPFNPNAIDCSKCLGKVNKPVPDETHAHPDTMDNKTFTNFIGNELIRKFKSFDAILVKEGLNNEFLILHQMWNYFGKPDREDNAIETVNMEVMEYENEEHSSELEEASTRSEALVELNEPSPSKNIQSDAKLSKITGDCETSDPFSIFIHTPGGRPEPKTRPLHVNSTDIASNNFGNIKLPQTLKTPSIDNNITDAATSLLPSTSKRCISDFLTMPDKPQRKNKRDVERVSFAITSRSYQENFEAKRALKLKEENEKLERKRLREEKAAAKANLETKRVLKSADGITNGNCFVCTKQLFKNSHYFKCDSCKKYIHRHCVPKKHKNHVPDLEDDDLFMCHLCYKEESDDGADSEDFDENEEEDSLEIDQNKNDNDLNDTNSDEKKKTDENKEEMNYSLCIKMNVPNIIR